MRKIIVSWFITSGFMLSSLCPGYLNAAEPVNEINLKRVIKAKQIASAWFDSLMRGDVAVTTALSDTPFAWDRKQTIESINKLEVMLESIVKDKGKRNITATVIELSTDLTTIQEKAIPADYIIVHVVIGDERVTICVKPGDTFKVVGFSD